MLQAFHILQGLYDSGIPHPLGIISFKDYMLQTFHKSYFVLHNFIKFLYKYSLVFNRHYIFRCVDYRFKYFIFYL